VADRENPLTEAFFYILLAVRKPNHGYGITQEVEMLTEGRLCLGAGTLYGAIQAMLNRGWIKLYSVDETSRKKKEYLITEAGLEAFQTEKARLEELLTHAKLMEERGI
jgi:DNA-binding PadR family transcriptional regulator